MLTTLCYIEKDNKYLMLYRNKKENDVNRGKYIGIGGKIEKGESPSDAMIREVMEETGLKVNSFAYRGLVIFNYNDEESLFMYLYHCDDFSGEVDYDCDEGTLSFVDIDRINELKLWEGDRIFLEILKDKTKPFFYLELNYKDDELIDYNLEYKEDEYCIFEVFVPHDYVNDIIQSLGKYNLLKDKNYDDCYNEAKVIGHWTPLNNARPFIGKNDVQTSQEETMLRFRIKKEFKELAFYLIKKTHPYEVPVINVFDSI